jgi:histidine kinase
LGNPLTNADKYTKTGGIVSITAKRVNSQVCICVKDTDAGIPMDEQPRIFDPFYRRRASGRFAKGMGLGLTIAMNLAEAHGGKLEMASELGKGSYFTLGLPMK